MSLSQQAFQHIQERRIRPWQGEEEVRIAWISALEAALDQHFDAERARHDGRLNNVIIEFKAPGFFRGSKQSLKFKEATEDRLLPYILDAAHSAHISAGDFIGIAIDGDHICFAQVRGETIHTEHLIPFSEHAVRLVIAAIQADTRRSISIENLLRDFGLGSSSGRAMMQALADFLAMALSERGIPKIKMLFEEWRSLYGQVASMSRFQASALERELNFTWTGDATKAMPGRLFVIHTYNSLVIKLLAAEIVSAHGLTAMREPSQGMATMREAAEILHALEYDIERAGIFEQAGINGFVEEALFSWYLDCKDCEPHEQEVVAALRDILTAMSLYRSDHLDHTRDVLRDFYQGLIPGRLRQSLGEYYTPDWLVDHTLNRVDSVDWLEKRVLDPTCGSGAFILAVIQRIRAAALQKGWSAGQVIDHLCTNVWGFDLNPLAVQTSRVNFLIAIADLLREAPGHTFEVPVLLADAIYSPAPDQRISPDVMRYRIGSEIAGLDVTLPTTLVLDRANLDQVFTQMGDGIEQDKEYWVVERELVRYKLVDRADIHDWRAPLEHTYNQILKLHRQQWNGIWFRIVRNFFWSTTAGLFDLVVGNPPWVRWSKLPEEYRKRVKPTCEHYGIFAETGRHGGNELDISAMITYSVADKWLKKNGVLGFVITGNIFKNPSSAGFRKFQLEPLNSKSDHLVPIAVDDMGKLKVFADATNHTTVVTFEKRSQPVEYPIPYYLWTNTDGSTRKIPVNLDLQDVMRRVVVTPMEATPVAGSGSPWAVLLPGRHHLLRSIAGKCAWVSGRKGVTTDLNGVFFVPILETGESLVKIRSRPEAGRINIGTAREAWIEPDLLYPLVKGAADFEPCYFKPAAPNFSHERLYTFVANRGINASDYQAASMEIDEPRLRRTKQWFAQYAHSLKARSTFRRQMTGAPNHAIYNVGDYTFQKWKVIWPEIASSFYAAVVSSAEVPLAGMRPYVPDHKVYFSSFDHKEPAYYLCGLLNTPTVVEWIDSHKVSTQIGNVFQHTNLPPYDEDNSDHTKLSKMVETAHQTHDAATRKRLLVKIQLLGQSILDGWQR